MRVLSLDSALAGCGVALWQDGQVLSRRDERPRGQAEALVPLVQAVMAEAGVGFGDLDRIAVTVGPGRFTGLRIGLSAARGLSLATCRPVYGVTVCDAYAAMAGTGADLAVVIDSLRADDVFAALYAADGQITHPPQTFTEDALVAILPNACRLAGDGAARLKLASRGDVSLLPPTAIDPAVVAQLAAARSDAGNSPADLRPLYLRPADVTLSVSRPAPV